MSCAIAREGAEADIPATALIFVNLETLLYKHYDKYC
jgi:hypothetical protein